MRIEFLYKLICYEYSLPSRTTALHEISMSVGRLEPRQLLRHMIALHRRAKLILVHMYVIASEYDSSFFSAILLAICYIVRVAKVLRPHEVILLNFKYSLLILEALQRLMLFVRFYGVFGHGLASGLKIFKLKK